jgi:hypothetical protein
MVQENDVVLIYCEDEPLMFARIEAFSPDIKTDWYHVKMLVLQLPLQVVTWILKDSYITGEEFTMNGKKIRLEKVVCPENLTQPDTPKKDQEILDDATSATVISLADLKKE